MVTDIAEWLRISELSRVDGASPRGKVCEVWAAAVDDVHLPSDLMSAEETERYGSFHQEMDGRRFQIGCGLARLFLSSRMHQEPTQITIDRTCSVCGMPHGKPRALQTSWQYSVSHSGDYVVLAFVEGAAVGVDVEAESLHRSDDLWGSVFTESEMEALAQVGELELRRSRLRLWTRKEAALKCAGTGLRVEPRHLEVSGPSEAPSVRMWPSALAEFAPPSLHDLEGLPGHAAALALASPVASIRVSIVQTLNGRS